MTIQNLDDVQAATTKELMAFYNAHHLDKPVSKFSDRKTAERRCMAIIEAKLSESITGEPLNTEEVESLELVVVHKTRAARTVNPEAEHSFQSDTPEDEVTEEEALAELAAMKASAATKKNTPSASSGLKLGEAIAKSWLVEETADARRTRHAVRVTANGTTGDFKSVFAAFEKLSLPTSKHIRFRGVLKANGKAIFVNEGIEYTFELVKVVA